MAPVIELADVSVVRGSTRLLSHVTWTVEDDERWVVIGPNGAGKTTLLQVLSTHLYPTEGIVGVLDEVVGTVDVFELRPRIGLTSAALADRSRGRSGSATWWCRRRTPCWAAGASSTTSWTTRA